MQRIPRNIPDKRLTQAEREARDYQNAPPYGAVEKGAEKLAEYYGDYLNGLTE